MECQRKMFFQINKSKGAQEPMNPEHCNDHSELMGIVGKMDGKLDMLIAGQEGTTNNISELYKLYNASHTETEIQKTKTAPIFWVVVVAGAILADIFIRAFLVHKP